MRPVNPFFTTNPIPDEYFCDRDRETNELLSEIESRNNMLLMSPRRMGKTGLINHLYEDPRIKGRYNTFFIDIYDTSTLKELTFRLGKEVYDRMSLWDKARASGFLGVLSSLRGELTLDPVSMGPRFALSVGQIRYPETTLDEIFAYLEGMDKPCIVAIDEFQKIAEYEEKDVEAILRTKIQRLGNVRFIFCGSEQHLLAQMFQTQARPFYRSTRTIILDRIEKPVYLAFAEGLFESYGKSISSECLSALYDLVDGYTFYLQDILSFVFSRSSDGKTVTLADLIEMLGQILDNESVSCKTVLSMLTSNQRQLLSAISMSGKALNVLSNDFVSRHHLGATSSVQSALRSLLKKQLVSRDGDAYYLDDKYMELYLRRESGAPILL